MLALIEVAFPAVSQSKPVMEELVGFRSWNLEAGKAFAFDDGLVALTAAESCSTFQKSPPLLPRAPFRHEPCPPREIQFDDREFPGGAWVRR